MARSDLMWKSFLTTSLILITTWLSPLEDLHPVVHALSESAEVYSSTLSSDKRQCTGKFEATPLPHYTRGPDEQISFFDSNGAGVALSDLDNDGYIDIVLAGLYGRTSILWNEGNLFFRRDDLPAPITRGVNAVDVDGDSNLDLIFTHPGKLPSWWRSHVFDVDDRPTFLRVEDERFRAWFPAYTTAWADLDYDGDLDMVGSSYDAELGALSDGPTVGGGVYFYRNDGSGLLTYEQLSHQAQGLAILLSDLDSDGRRDILIGNDFALSDFVYLNRSHEWSKATIFNHTPTNTMSFAEGDIDNDGYFEILATDMKPYEIDEETTLEWGPLWADTADLQPQDGIQTTSNVLHTRQQPGNSTIVFIDTAKEAGLEATGWSWSAQFGDMDNDGYLDLYVVNGMIAAEIFSHLPLDELVEENQAFRNLGNGSFIPVPEWELNATQSGRGMSLADLDNDGDLDVVVNNLSDPAILFENRLCGGKALEVELRWKGVPNNRAIGAQLTLHTSSGLLLREVRANSGYLSSDPTRIHFGIGAAKAGDLLSLEIVWPDGETFQLQELEVNTLISVVRSDLAVKN